VLRCTVLWCAQMVAEGRLQGVAAIASSRAAELYGLEILAEGIQVLTPLPYPPCPPPSWVSRSHSSLSNIHMHLKVTPHAYPRFCGRAWIMVRS